MHLPAQLQMNRLLHRILRLTRRSYSYRFNFGYSNYAHHATVPTISSLADLSDPIQMSSLVPVRRAPGSPSGTISVRCGDDAMIMSPLLLGVADGVSSWSEMANSGLWARVLLETLSRKISSFIAESSRPLVLQDLRNLLDEAYLHATNLMELDHLKGSSTVLLCLIQDKVMHVISVGDSRLFFFREGEILWSNNEQMISLFCPQQLGTQNVKVPPSEVAQFKSIVLREKDALVICSDGITDNLWPEEILFYVEEGLFTQKKKVQEMANHLLYKVKDVAFDNFCASPYVEKVNMLPSKTRTTLVTGGKMDDISCCVAMVVGD